MKKTTTTKFKKSERSFTLVETVVALGLLVYLVVEFVGLQGSSLSSTEYGRKIAQASWLARRVMSQVEYFSQTKDWKSLTVNETDKPFEDVEGFTYNLSIQEWKLPLLSILSGGFGGDDKKEDSSKDGLGSGFEGILKQVLGDDLLKIAKVEVNWPEGAAKGSLSLAYVLVNQKKVDEVILQLKAVEQATGGGNPGGPKTSGSPPPSTPPAQSP